MDDATFFLVEFEMVRWVLSKLPGLQIKNGMSFEISGSKGSLRFEFEHMNEVAILLI